MLAEPADRVLVSESWVVSTAPDQGYLGRCYVATRQHRQYLRQLTAAKWQDFAGIVSRLELALGTALDATLLTGRV